MMLVTVTQGDIDAGIRRNCGHCPVAIALRRVYPTADIHVDGIRASIEGERRLLPPIARNFIDAFDHGRPVQPIAFPLRELRHLRHVE